MKNIFFVLLILTSLTVASTETNEFNNDKELYIGHISIEENILYLDEVEWITNENKDRIQELGLSKQSDMPNGYFIHNPSTDIASFDISSGTIYNFIAFEHLSFLEEGEDRNYSTANKEEFLEYINAYSDKAAKVLFWVEVQNDQVVSITEQFTN